MNQPRHNHTQPEPEDDENDGLTVFERLEEIPKFANEDEEDDFWATHTLASHLFTRRGQRPGSLRATIERTGGPPESGSAAFITRTQKSTGHRPQAARFSGEEGAGAVYC